MLTRMLSRPGREQAADGAPAGSAFVLRLIVPRRVSAPDQADGGLDGAAADSGSPSQPWPKLTTARFTRPM